MLALRLPDAARGGAVREQEVRGVMPAWVVFTFFFFIALGTAPWIYHAMRWWWTRE